MNAAGVSRPVLGSSRPPASIERSALLTDLRHARAHLEKPRNPQVNWDEKVAIKAVDDAINEIGQKMVGIIAEHAKQNSYTMVLDVSSPQTPVLYADSGLDITAKIIELYNAAPKTAAAPRAPAAAPKPPAAATAPARPPAAAPAPKP